jgi:AcrR family transcriptional regulator
MLNAMKSLAKTRPVSKTMASRAARRPVGKPNAPEDIRDAVWRIKREGIVAAAVDLFYHKGYARTTLEEVADAIHVTKPFIYSHFNSKSHLLAEICMRGTRVSHEALMRALEPQGTPTEKLQAIVRDFMEAILNHQAHAVIYSREEKELAPQDREAINQLRREFDHRLAAVLEEGVARGEFIVQDAPLTALAIVGMVAWSQMWYRSGGRLTKEQAAESMASLVLSMVRATPAGRSTAGTQVVAN